MLNIGDLVRNPNNAEDFLKFISYNGYQYLHEVTAELGSFVENGFLKTLFDKSPQHKLKAQNTLNKKSGNTGHSSNCNQPKKKDKKSSTKTAKDDIQLKNLNSQKKAKKFSKKYSAFLAAEFFLLFILLYKPLALEGLASVLPYFYPVRMDEWLFINLDLEEANKQRERAPYFSQVEKALAIWTTNVLAAELVINGDILHEKSKNFCKRI
ncbi:hypothetical protein RhiirA1_499763 [Rhizophagus irregularis]|uniref:Uncharacterized protein n=1 Tax=Rhizophagus irregularis TaxID=588596 RepID=A0A2N0R0S0_9GLOM|nr:hypothetical protein RhiirA1_499763 [Rhizophagus irregularis]